MAAGGRAPAMQANGMLTSSPTEDEELYREILHIQDAVLAGRHPQFRLPHAVIERLKASAHTHVLEPPRFASTASRGATRSSTSTDRSQSSHATSHAMSSARLPGLHASANGTASQHGAKRPSYPGLDPIFLEKSDSLVRAEGQLKRQRIERELQVQVEHRRQTARERDQGADAPSAIDIEAVLDVTATRVKHVSGLKAAMGPVSPADSSFDENDYYSSQVQSEWSRDASASKNSDPATGAFTGDFERLDMAETSFASLHKGGPATLTTPSGLPPRTSEDQPQVPAVEADDEYDPEEMDDEYTPPAASAFEHASTQGPMAGAQPVSSGEDNSEYEPGEVASADAWAPGSRNGQQAAQDSPQVPVIRNQLTHIAAPQPNRVSPLAVVKGPGIELELVNGRPELVHRLLQNTENPNTRVSSASRSGNNTGPSNKKLSKKAKKRKRREEEAAAAAAQPRSKKKRGKDRPDKNAPFIKDEPTSPPSLWASVSDVKHPYDQPQFFGNADGVNASASLRPGSPDAQGNYNGDGLRRSKRLVSLRSNEAVASQPSANSETLNPTPRHSQAGQRVMELHYEPVPRSSAQHGNPPYPSASLTYGEYNPSHPTYRTAEPDGSRHRGQGSAPVQMVQIPPPQTPLRSYDYQGRYDPGEPHVAMMPPPAPVPRQIVEDQYGNRYYAAEAVPRPATRTSMAPIDRRPPTETDFEHASSRMPTTYAPQYGRAESRMAPPPVPMRAGASDEQRVYQTDSNGYQLRGYGTPHAEPVRYLEQPRSPVYQQAHRYETMPPPPAPMPPPTPTQTSPVYAPRAYSVRPEEAAPITSAYMPRQASVAPVQYVRQEAPPPARAMSVMPEFEHAPPPPYRSYGYAGPVRYVDQNGQVVYPQEVRQFSEYRY